MQYRVGWRGEWAVVGFRVAVSAGAGDGGAGEESAGRAGASGAASDGCREVAATAASVLKRIGQELPLAAFAPNSIFECEGQIPGHFGTSYQM